MKNAESIMAAFHNCCLIVVFQAIFNFCTANKLLTNIFKKQNKIFKSILSQKTLKFAMHYFYLKSFKLQFVSALTYSCHVTMVSLQFLLLRGSVVFPVKRSFKDFFSCIFDKTLPRINYKN